MSHTESGGENYRQGKIGVYVKPPKENNLRLMEMSKKVPVAGAEDLSSWSE